MLRFFCFASLAALGVISPAHAQTIGDICTLSDSTSLFLSRDGPAVALTLEAGSGVIVKDTQGNRWMVQTTEGRLGFVPRTRLGSGCKEGKTSPAERRGTTSNPIDSASVAETAAALDVARAAAENSNAVEQDVVRSQAQILERSRAARGDDCSASDSNATFRVAVYDPELVNIPEGMGGIITSSLLAEIRKLEGASVIGMNEIREMLNFEAQRQSMGCDADESCLAQIAGALGVDEIITGRLSEEADGRTLLVRRIDQRRAEVVTTVTKRLALGTGEEFLLALGPAVEQLYPNRPNRPGTTRGVAKKLLLRLNPPPIAPATTLTTIGLSVAVLALGGTTALLGQGEVANYNSAFGQEDGYYSGEQLEVFHDSQQKAQNLVMIGNVGLVAGGLLALTSTVMSFFTDWALLGDSEEGLQYNADDMGYTQGTPPLETFSLRF